MAEVFKIVPAKPQPNTIKYLEQLLARAKTGKIQGFAIVLDNSKGRTSNGWTGIGINCMSVVGEVESMKFDLINANVDQ